MARLQNKKQAAVTTVQPNHPAGSTDRRNTSETEVAMSIRKKRSTRRRLGSLGRPIESTSGIPCAMV
jgi:hypothetical protein